MALSPDTLAELKELLYEENWYIDTRWGDMSQQGNAQRVNRRMLSLITEGAYTHPDAAQEQPEPIEVPEPVEDIADYQPPVWQIKSGAFPIVGRRFSPAEFLTYAKWVQANESFHWNPTGITAHHTAYPSLDMRPDGFTEQHMRNLRDYYKNSMGWSSGPQVFTDDKGIWVLTPLTHRGVHAKSFNSTRIGIEMLGDFDYKDDPDTGRGRLSTYHGKFAAAAMMKAFGISTGKLNFHRDDPKTSKSCPGKKISFEAFEADVKAIYDSLT